MTFLSKKILIALGMGMLVAGLNLQSDDARIQEVVSQANDRIQQLIAAAQAENPATTPEAVLDIN